MDGITEDPLQQPGGDPPHRPGRHLRMTLPAVPSSVRVARHAIARLLDDDRDVPERREAATLAVSEAVSNAVLHAYEEPGGPVALFAIRVGTELIVTVSDRGCGLDRPAARPGLGVGLQLIRGSAEQALIATREGGGATVQCRFVLSDRSTLIDSVGA